MNYILIPSTKNSTLKYTLFHEYLRILFKMGRAGREGQIVNLYIFLKIRAFNVKDFIIERD